MLALLGKDKFAASHTLNPDPSSSSELNTNYVLVYEQNLLNQKHASVSQHYTSCS